MKYIHFKLLLTAFVISVFYFNVDAQNINTHSASVKAKSDSLKIDSLKKIRAENVFFEVGGVGCFFTLNYDTRFNKRRNGLGIRVGTGYFEHTFTPFFQFDLADNPPHTRKFFSLPVQINYLAGKKSHFAEFGLGATFTMFNGNGRSSNVLFPIAKPGNQFKLINTLTVGYRYQPLKGGVNVRVNADIMYTAIYVMPTAGISVGYTFKGKRPKTKTTEQGMSPEDKK